MERVRIDGKGRVTIPKRLREILNLREGEEVLLVPEKDGLLIKRASDPEEILERLLGDLTFSRELRKVAEQEALRETSI
ncbi:hypothetical protein MA03_03665 [Infirmifilum uzonense]|uniref:SpoVT-AbrB domain-containing protein n=1 Tax=Infirmifilum uzonense TaxID=1550241 RepID=A0A0F7CL03_9CREN|nr:AbrB/MazE/SpoVT family DNA-binding domain-containing protein [Infirmifilum uzonense]AKG38561.1 hypothetical protein MA03_03665 [Infirmifilum uzonense]